MKHYQGQKIHQKPIPVSSPTQRHPISLGKKKSMMAKSVGPRASAELPPHVSMCSTFHHKNVWVHNRRMWKKKSSWTKYELCLQKHNSEITIGNYVSHKVEVTTYVLLRWDAYHTLVFHLGLFRDCFGCRVCPICTLSPNKLTSLYFRVRKKHNKVQHWYLSGNAQLPRQTPATTELPTAVLPN
jgi:hypothetical protein